MAVSIVFHSREDVCLVDMKSYGRAPTFLAPTSSEKVRSVIVGDHEAAELVFPKTGICGGSGLFDQTETKNQVPPCSS